MTTTHSATTPEVARTIDVQGIATNYHDVGAGDPVLLVHGSGPGVTAAVASGEADPPPALSAARVIAPLPMTAAAIMMTSRRPMPRGVSAGSVARAWAGSAASALNSALNSSMAGAQCGQKSPPSGMVRWHFGQTST